MKQLKIIIFGGNDMAEDEKIRLTQLSSMGGCASKFGPGNLANVLSHLRDIESTIDPNLMVGLKTSDDAGVYRISSDLALIQTVDFFTPVVDDPYTFGLVAAANALSDVYAMGGKPLTALNICCFSTGVPPEVLAEILRGGVEKIMEAGAVLLGGHTVTDKEIKYGVSVTGTVHPDKVVTNAGAKVGDVLILTKPLGTGILSTAFKNDAIGEEGLAEAIRSMTTLNKAASEAMQKVGVNACTDVTGFGLTGHLYEMASASGVYAKVFSSELTIMAGVIEQIEKENIPGGAFANKKHFGQWVDFDAGVSEFYKIEVFDPQTSGGLLIAVPKSRANELINELIIQKVLCSKIIGEIIEEGTRSNVITIERGSL
jgi:selenide, water dikinase